MSTVSDKVIAQAAIAAGFNPTPIGSRTPAVIMVAIAIAESSGRNDVVNPKHKSGTYGLWQISKSDHPDLWNENWRDPQVNAKMAKGVFDKQGYSAWSVYGKGFGVYRTKLPRAIQAVQDATIDNAPAPKLPDLPKLPDPLEDAKKLADLVTNKENWVRLGLFLVGALLLLIGVLKVTGIDSQVGKAVSTAVKSRVPL